MTIKLAVQENLLDGDNLVRKWDVLRRIGFDGIELRGAAGLSSRLDELRAAKRAGVVMSSICIIADRFIGDFVQSRRDEALAMMSELCDVAGEIGIKGVVTPASYGMHSNRLPPFTALRTAAEDRAILIDVLGRLGRHAAQRGVEVWLEPLNRYEDHMVNTLAQGVDLVQAVGLPSVRIMADLFHMNIEEDNSAEALRKSAAFVAHVHAADSQRIEPGLGQTDFAAAFAALNETGFDGFAAIECRFRQPADAALRTAYSALNAARKG